MKPAIEVCGMMKKRLSGGMIKCKIRAKGRKRRQRKIKDRWSEYSNELLNEENKKNPVTQAASTEGLVLDLQWKK